MFQNSGSIDEEKDYGRNRIVPTTSWVSPPGSAAFADELRAAAHVVHTPDLLDAHTFPTLDEGMAYARTVGFETILYGGVAAAEALGPELVYAGFSMGVMPALQKLAQTREGAKGAVVLRLLPPGHGVW